MKDHVSTPPCEAVTSRATVRGEVSSAPRLPPLSLRVTTPGRWNSSFGTKEERRTLTPTQCHGHGGTSRVFRLVYRRLFSSSSPSNRGETEVLPRCVSSDSPAGVNVPVSVPYLSPVSRAHTFESPEVVESSVLFSRKLRYNKF